jgi:hypothetical protein
LSRADTHGAEGTRGPEWPSVALRRRVTLVFYIYFYQNLSFGSIHRSTCPFIYLSINNIYLSLSLYIVARICFPTAAHKVMRHVHPGRVGRAGFARVPAATRAPPLHTRSCDTCKLRAMTNLHFRHTKQINILSVLIRSHMRASCDDGATAGQLG